MRTLLFLLFCLSLFVTPVYALPPSDTLLPGPDQNQLFQEKDSATYYCMIPSCESRALIAPVCLMSTGLLLISNDLFDRQDVKRIASKVFKGFDHSLDDYLQYAPVAAAYLIDLCGYPSSNHFLKKSVILAEAEIMMLASVRTLKLASHVLRPDGSNYESFPSGHTAQAFVAASFLAHEYGKKSPWIAVAGYTAAAVTGCMRILNNRHWASDVLFGAGIGILCTELAYRLNRNSVMKFNSKLALLPAVGNKQYGAALYWVF